MPNVDLQAISIDPEKPQIKKGERISILSLLRNNGPDVLPKGEAKVMITLSNTILTLPRNRNFKSTVKGQWKFGGARARNGFWNLWFLSNADLPINQNGEGFQFDVVGKNYGESMVTLNSSLTATATSGDVQGFNQAVHCVLKVAKK